MKLGSRDKMLKHKIGIFLGVLIVILLGLILVFGDSFKRKPHKWPRQLQREKPEPLEYWCLHRFTTDRTHFKFAFCFVLNIVLNIWILSNPKERYFDIIFFYFISVISFSSTTWNNPTALRKIQPNLKAEVLLIFSIGQHLESQPRIKVNVSFLTIWKLSGNPSPWRQD